MRGLRLKSAFIFIGVASSIILLSGMILGIEIHYHFEMYKRVSGVEQSHPEMTLLDQHFMQAMSQTILWTTIGSILLAICFGILIANRLTAPLLRMQEIAEEMAQGKLNKRLDIKGKDELSDLGESINKLAEQLQQQEILRKNMTSDIAHELRTPLATLKSHIEAMLDGVWEPTMERIQVCFDETERMIHLVGELEQLTFLESPEFHLELKEEDVSTILEHVLQFYEPLYRQKGVDIHHYIPEPIIAVVDRERLTQVFMNVLSNALKYTDSGGSVSVSIQKSLDEIVIKVSDTGIGIDKQDLPFVFERFYRTDKSRNRKSGGNGIGLTIVKRLVDAHRGTISIDSEPGKGTEVLITLPARSAY
jgi:two-component system sensor histidine kinase BaeS